MKITIISLAMLAGLSGAAFAERPTESSDRVDYNLSSSFLSVNNGNDTNPLFVINRNTVNDSEIRRLDEKNDENNS